MTQHMIWGLIGFNLALLFVWIFYILRTRGFSFFWQRPVIAVILLIVILYVLESFFQDLAAAEIKFDWELTFWVGIPLCILGLAFFYRAIRMHFGQKHME